MFDWAVSSADRSILKIPDDGPIYVISDIHLGDGTPSDIFLAKDKDLLAFLKQVRDEDARLVIAGDAMEHEGQYDAILLDAPCSATGTIRRRPDIMGRRSSADITSLPLQQKSRALLVWRTAKRQGAPNQTRSTNQGEKKPHA